MLLSLVGTLYKSIGGLFVKNFVVSSSFYGLLINISSRWRWETSVSFRYEFGYSMNLLCYVIFLIVKPNSISRSQMKKKHYRSIKELHWDEVWSSLLLDREIG